MCFTYVAERNQLKTASYHVWRNQEIGGSNTPVVYEYPSSNVLHTYLKGLLIQIEVDMNQDSRVNSKFNLLPPNQIGNLNIP